MNFNAADSKANPRECELILSDLDFALISAFLNSKKFKGKAKSTMDPYKNALVMFAKWIKKTSRNFIIVPTPDIFEYAQSLIARGLNPATIYFYLHAIRLLYNFLLGNGSLPRRLVPKICTIARKPVKKYIALNEIQQLQNDVTQRGRWKLRDLAIFEIMLLSGITCRELRNLKICDVMFRVDIFGREITELSVMSVSTNERRSIPIGQQSTELIERYLVRRSRKFKDSPYLFVDRTGDRIKPGILYYRIRKFLGLCQPAETKGGRILRASYGVALLERGAAIQEVHQLLGLKKILSTYHYSMQPIPNLKTTLKSVFPERY